MKTKHKYKHSRAHPHTHTHNKIENICNKRQKLWLTQNSADTNNKKKTIYQMETLERLLKRDIKRKLRFSIKLFTYKKSKKAIFLVIVCVAENRESWKQKFWNRSNCAKYFFLRIHIYGHRLLKQHQEEQLNKENRQPDVMSVSNQANFTGWHVS